MAYEAGSGGTLPSEVRPCTEFLPLAPAGRAVAGSGKRRTAEDLLGRSASHRTRKRAPSDSLTDLLTRKQNSVREAEPPHERRRALRSALRCFLRVFVVGC